MSEHSALCSRHGIVGRPQFEVADIFRAHGDVYRKNHVVTPEQRTVMRAIEQCRTAALGGHLDTCDSCDYEAPSYNSCRNRHCPKCQSLAQHAWLERRSARILPTHYFHVVATLPHELNALAISNRKTVYDLLLRCAAQSLVELGKDRLCATVGVTAVLHTWSRDLQLHPHVHCIVTGGGLSESREDWLETPEDYLFPVKVISKVFRGKFLAALSQKYDEQKLVLEGSSAELADAVAFDVLRDHLYRKEWITYAKRPFGGAGHVMAYLGRYTHRVAIGNHRMVRLDSDSVTFATKAGKTVTVSPDEFIRRFLLHILPRGFTKIRHFGLLAPSNVRTRFQEARHILEHRSAPCVDAPSADSEPQATEPPAKTWAERLEELTGIDATLCPRCGLGRLHRRPLPAPECRVSTPLLPEPLDSS